jgi:hypothetical protein
MNKRRFPLLQGRCKIGEIARIGGNGVPRSPPLGCNHVEEQLDNSFVGRFGRQRQ